MVRLWRSFLIASTLALGAVTGPGIAANAIDKPVMVPATSGSRVVATHLACPNRNGKIIDDCSAVVGFYAGPHPELPQTALASNTALACNGNSYLDWYTYYRFVNSIGTTLVYVRMAGEDWYNYCSAGNVYINRTNCDVDLGYQCDGWRQGSFWDGGKNANTDWGNQQTQITLPGNYTVYRCFYLRWWTHPDGTWSYQDTTSQTGGGWTC